MGDRGIPLENLTGSEHDDILAGDRRDNFLIGGGGHDTFKLSTDPFFYASWLNQVERWFGLITQQAIRRGSFSSVKQLVNKINQFVNHYNDNSRPFVWTATAESILNKVERLCTVISGTAH